MERPRAVSLDVTWRELGQPDVEGDGTEIGLAYTHRRASSPHVFRIGYRNGSSSRTQAITTGLTSFVLETETDEQEVFLEYGRYVRKRWLVGLRASYNMSDHDGRSDSRFVVVRGASLDTAGVELFTHWLKAVSNGTRWVVLRAGLELDHLRFESGPVDHAESELLARVGAGYFFSRKTSATLDVSANDEADEISVSLGIDHFFTEGIGAGISGGRTFLDHSRDDGTTIAARLTARF